MTAETGGASGVNPKLNENQLKMKPNQPYILRSTNGKGKKEDNNDDDNGDSSFRFMGHNTSSVASSIAFPSLPNLASLCARSIAFATITLFVLNQKHMLPMPVGRVVSKLMFWPTIPITITRRIGKWTTVIDNAVVLGGAPFGWYGYPEKISKQFNVKGVINMCEEYRGPVSSYKRLGIEHLRLPTVDHFEPSVDDLKKAVSFIARHESQGGRVYVHCKAGHGRSAAAVYAWLLYKEPLADPVELNEKLCDMRNVRKSLWRQPNINIFRHWLRDGGMMSDSESDDDDYSWSRQQGIKPYGDGRYANTINPDSDTEYSDSDDSDGRVNHSKFGKVFNDDESDTDDFNEENELLNNAYEYDEDFSEDEKDYEMWKRYQKQKDEF